MAGFHVTPLIISLAASGPEVAPPPPQDKPHHLRSEPQRPELNSALCSEGTEVVLAHGLQACLRIDLRRSNPLVPEELLHLIQGHTSIQQNRRDAGAQPVRRDLFGNPGPLRRLMHEALNIPGGVRLPAIALEHASVVTTVQVGAQFLRYRRQERHVSITAAFCFRNVDLRRIERQVQILNAELHELTDPGAGVEQHLQHEAVAAAMGICGLDEPRDFSRIEPFHGSAALSRWFKVQFAAGLFDDVFGLVVRQVMPAP